MGNVIAHFDMKALCCALLARNVGRFIANGGCACRLANQAFSNILFHPAFLAREGARTERFVYSGDRSLEAKALR